MNTDRKWYQKKRFIIPIALVVISTAVASFGGENDQYKPTIQGQNVVVPPSSTQQNVVQPEIKITPLPAPVTSPNLSNDNYYINVDGNKIHSPAYSDSIPSGASAKCRDGTYSFSQNRRGTCSRHGGVATWY